MILCPRCGKLAYWNSYFGCYICEKCHTRLNREGLAIGAVVTKVDPPLVDYVLPPKIAKQFDDLEANFCWPDEATMEVRLRELEEWIDQRLATLFVQIKRSDPMVIAKFRVDTKTEFPKYNDDGATPFQVKMTGVQSEPFGKFTPSASLDMLILNDEAAKQFTPGKEYLVRFEPA